MRKIISLFKRDYEGTRLVYDEVTEGAEWVLNNEGVATRKWDGTACLIKGGILFKRYDCKNGKTPPEGFVSAQEPDLVTGHWPGWVLVSADNPQDKHHRAVDISGLEDGTYELCGPKVNGNPEGLSEHRLIRHGEEQFEDTPTAFEELKEWFRGKDIEGIVWHHPDGRMVKIKKRDFGMKRSD